MIFYIFEITGSGVKTALYTHALLQGISFEDGGVVVLKIFFLRNTGSGEKTTQGLSFIDGGGLVYRLPIFVLQKTVG